MAEKKKQHILLKLLLPILILPAVFLTAVSCYHRVCRKYARKSLQESGYQYAKGAGDYALSYIKSGSEYGNHILVALSGMGIHDYSVTLQPMAEYLEPNNLFVYPDRAGYGISGDTKTPQTTEQIVADYRAVLQNAGIQPPYVLLPHSLGGIYATYWESTYPDEIEGVFYLDCTALQAADASSDDEAAPDAWNYLQAAGCRIGLQRLVLHRYYPELPNTYPANQKNCSETLNSYGTYTAAQLSEERLLHENCRTAWENIVTNDIPKAFISASWAIRTEAEWEECSAWMDQARLWQTPLPEDDTEAQRKKTAAGVIAEGTALTETVLMPYLEKLGNCTYFALPGSHVIYEQKPMQCAVLLSQFLARIEADSEASAEAASLAQHFG